MSIKMEMHMAGKFKVGEAAKVAVLCLPPVILSLIGLAAMGRKPAQGLAARGKAPAAGAKTAAGAAAKPQPRRPA